MLASINIAEQIGNEAKAARGLKTPSRLQVLQDGAHEIAINNMLFQPHTPYINFVSNVAMLGMKPLETATGVALSAFSAPENKIYPAELLAETAGFASGILQAVKYNGQRLKNLLPGPGVSVEEALKNVGAPETLSDISKIFEHKRVIHSNSDSLIGKFVNGLGAAINAPGNILNHTDITFKIIHAEQSKMKLAQRLVSMGKEESIASAYKTIEKSPELMQKLVSDAEYYTYQGHPKSSMFSWIMDSKIADNTVMRWVIPFKRSIANIAEMSVERSPLALAVPKLRQQLISENPRIRAEAQAHLVAGTALTAVLGYTLASHLNGKAPKDPVERDMWIKTYGKPFTLQIGGTEIELDAFGPLGTILKTVALYNQWNLNKHDIFEDPEKTGSMATVKEFAKFVSPILYALDDTYWAKNLTEFLSDVQKAVEEQDPTSLMRWTERMATLSIPGVGSQEMRRLAEEQDPTKHIYKNPGDIFKRQFVEAAKTVRSSYAWDGSKMLVNRYQSRMILPFLANPYYKDDPMQKELVRLGVRINELKDYIHAPTPTGMGQPGPKVYLTDEEWDKYNQLIHEGLPQRGLLSLRQILEAVMKSPGYTRRKSDALKRIIIESVITRYRKAAKEVLKTITPLGARAIEATKIQQEAIKSAEGIQ